MLPYVWSNLLWIGVNRFSDSAEPANVLHKSLDNTSKNLAFKSIKTESIRIQRDFQETALGWSRIGTVGVYSEIFSFD